MNYHMKTFVNIITMPLYKKPQFNLKVKKQKHAQN